MARRSSNQDVTWFLDEDRNGKLNLDPPYQRRSVWTRKDKQFFLDTIFHNCPSPAIFLHKSIDDDGMVTHHVVDGKQRLKTILEFSKNEISLPKDFGDSNLNGKQWSDLKGNKELQNLFWNYVLPVEFLDTIEPNVINNVFDRLNRNSRKLTRQELRHAKFEGWFATLAEAESEKEEWKKLGVVTTGRAKRMGDIQFISELMIVLLEGKYFGFNQDFLDETYAKYDDPEENCDNFSEEDFKVRFEATKDFLLEINKLHGVALKYAKSLGNFYTLWSVVAQIENRPSTLEFAKQYAEFMERVERLNSETDLSKFIKEQDESYQKPLIYFENTRGANTDFPQRDERFKSLSSAIRR